MKKVVIIGPESTGKSTLCSQLADHYNTLWCPEYAREYMLKHGTKYSFEDLLTIAKGQLRLEEEYTKRALDRKDTFLFIDTDMYVMKVWCEFVFSNCHSWIIDQIVSRTYDLYLLCNIDLPWVADELREYPDLISREKLYNIYKDIMINQYTPWVDISGDYDQRLEVAIKAIDKL
ncbi:MAG: ATPase [Bacteroidetes bacterium]|nr:MAG: ATPase [Bacteroidota bacterium]